MTAAVIGHHLRYALILLALAACGSGNAVDLTDADANRTVDLQVGQHLVITLQGFGSAGYLWR